jgi:Na+-translocating ferredoxin:NAD+ oxidoreductase RnfD subunit
MCVMDFLRDLLLFFHFIGLAALFGGLFVQIKAEPRVVNNAMFHGILTQLVTGLALVGVLEGMPDEDVNHAKIGVKLVVALVIGALVVVNRKKRVLPNGLYFALLGLTVLNIGVAVFWH